ncbi:MAG: hypothetical protein AB8I08_05385 [Sandaracinaceae bacterium]
MRRSLLSVLLCVSGLFTGSMLSGCDNGPYCGEFEDMAGRRVAFCPNPRQDPVCDLPGEEARFEEGPGGGLTLVGGERGSCNAEGIVVCPMGTIGEPYCITDPQL